jgi:GT2 family glycosyltransferase/SAM-dependent methyltransferase
MGEIFRRTKPEAPLAWTGERLTTGAGLQVEVEHLHRYLLARDLCRGMDVLDVASGEGYGSALLAQTAKSVVGVELDPGSVEHAQRSYASAMANLSFLLGDARKLPLPDTSVDIVVSFETIEHFYDHELFLAEVRRVLRPGGRFVVSSPERDVYSPAAQSPNPYHVRELTRFEFASLLRQHFKHITLLGQRPMLGSALVAEEPISQSQFRPMLTFERRGDDWFEASTGLPRPVYLVAVASDSSVEMVPDSLYIDSFTIEPTPAPDVGHLEVQLVKASQEIEATKASLQARDQAINELSRSVGRLHLENAMKAEDARAIANSIAIEAGRKISQLEKRAAELHSTLNAILSSSSWRVTNPLRSFLENRQQARLVLRRCAKLFWWTATFQLPRRVGAYMKARSTLKNLQDSAGVPASLLNPEVGVEDPDAAPVISEAVGLPEKLDEKALFTSRARGELLEFLTSGERISFSETTSPDISIIIVLWNQAHLTLRCLRALLTQVGPSIEVVLVDNASSDETQSLLSRVDGVRVITSATNDGFLLGCNRGAEAASGRTLLLLNSDAFLRPGALSAALSTLDAAPDVGAVGGRLILPTGLLQEAGSIVWADASTLGYGRGLHQEAHEAMFRRDVDYCSGAFLLTPTDLWKKLGGLDVSYAPAYYEEADYCMRLRELGYRVVYEPNAIIDHFEFGSEGKRGDAVTASQRNRKRFRLRHGTTLNQNYLPPAPRNILPARERLTPGRRRLLVFDNEVPLSWLGSGYPRASAMLREAAAMGWSVTFFPLHQLAVDWEVARREVPWEVEIVSNRAVSQLAEFLEERQGHYDVVIISRPDNMALLQRVLGERPHLMDGARVIYDAEALFSARDVLKAKVVGSPLSDDEIERITSDEVALAKGADAVICVNDVEASVFRSRLNVPVHVISHPADPVSDRPGFSERSGFLFVGRLLEKDTPNWQGLAWFVRECWPLIRAKLPKATLSVAGHLHSDHAELQGPGISLLGPIEELAPLYDSARVFVSPVRYAAGVPIKIIEATAAGLPTAGSLLMAKQLSWAPGTEIVGEDNADALAEASVYLHEDSVRWEAMRSASQARLAAEHGAVHFRDQLRLLLDGADA